MTTDSQKQDKNKSNNQTEKKHEEKKGHPPHDLPPHLLRELFDLKEKVGRLEGQIDILLRFISKK